MPSAASKRFRHIYDALPLDAQQLLVQDHLIPLLDAVPGDRQRRVVASALQFRRRYARMPSLSLDAKKAEIAALLFELSRDSKRSIVKERSCRDQLLSEAVDSIVKWLNDIWKVVFEFRTHFTLAHACLLFACDALEQIGNACGGCKCSYSCMFIPLKITRSTGEVVKTFRLDSVLNLESVMLWIWRDIFMVILAVGSRHQRRAIPGMLHDIHIVLGWRSLEQVLRGGTKCTLDGDIEDHDEAYAPGLPGRQIPIVDEEEENYVSDDYSSVCDDELHPGCFYAAHWSWRIADQQSQLRDLVHTALLDIFKVSPSGALYSSMMFIADDEHVMGEELHPLLMSVAGHSSENLSAALRILSLKGQPDDVNNLVQSYKHLLRPQDAASLQLAVLIMSNDFLHRTSAMVITEEELLDVAKQLHAAIRLSFCNIDSEIQKAELVQILALPRDSLNRRTRVERWVRGMLAPHVGAHPMVLAALMMGMPLAPGTEGSYDADILGYCEVDGDDPELEDLREEFRPNFKARFQGWVDTAIAIKGGPGILSKVYAKIILDMPFLKAGDVVDEMSARIMGRPGKVHVRDALVALKDFCEKQHLKLAASKKKGKGKARQTNSGPATASLSSNINTGASKDMKTSRNSGYTSMWEMPLEEFGLEAAFTLWDPSRDID